MHPLVSSLIRPFYEKNKQQYQPQQQLQQQDVLIDAPSVENYPEITGLSERLLFFNHNFLEEGEEEEEEEIARWGRGRGGGGLSRANRGEAEMVVALGLYLMSNGYMGEKLAIITPYVGQLLLIRSILAQKEVLFFL